MVYDVVIIGAGPAGISASLYTKRANLNTLILYKEESTLRKAHKVDNYYGFENGIEGEKLYEQGIKQAENLGVELKKEEVVNIKFNEGEFEVLTSNKVYNSKTVILATGNKKNSINIEGAKRLEGKGISYCAVCDGFFFRNKDVAVLGSGDYAISEMNELINIANSIILLTNGEIAPHFRSGENVKVNTNKIRQIRGGNQVEEIEFEDNTRINVDGVFVAQGVASSTDFAKRLGIVTQGEKIVVNSNMETNIRGLYACGDCTGGIFQISKAVYEGMQAGMQAIKFLNGNIS